MIFHVILIALFIFITKLTDITLITHSFDKLISFHVRNLKICQADEKLEPLQLMIPMISTDYYKFSLIYQC